jgi:hypothetical protein
MVDEEPKRGGGWTRIALLSAVATAGGLYLCVSNLDAPPRPLAKTAATAEGPGTTSSSATPPSASATPPGSQAPPAPSAGASATDTAPSDGPAPPAPGETRVRAIWDARAARRPGNALLGGAPCSLEATLANASGAIVVRGVTVRCDKTALHDPDGIPADATVTATEIAAIDRGSFAYTLQYRDGRADIDTRHARAEIDVRGPSPGTAYLLVANESRPVKQKLLPATPDERPFHAGTRPSPETDDRAAGRITAVSGDTLVKAGDRCALAFHPYGTIDGIDRCDVLVQCGGVVLLGRPELFSSHCKRKGTRVLTATDPEAQPDDDDPGLALDERTARIWSNATGARWSALLALDPR